MNSYRIMIVDDEPVNLTAIASHLKDMYSISIAKNGEEALKRMEANPADLILLDINMPGMDGFEVAERLKMESSTASIPIIFLTSDTRRESVIRAIRVKGSDFITKPVDKEELIRRIENQLIMVELRRSNAQKDAMLIQQAKLAAMGEMIANIAHQWRQPLMMLSMGTLALDKKFNKGELDTEYMGKYIEKTTGIIDKMNQTILDFSDFFKPNKLPEPFSPELTVRKSLDFLMPMMKRYEIDINFDSDIHSTMTGYPNELSQVIFNLLKNSIDALKERSDIKRIITVHAVEDDKEWKIKVSDNGGGIPQTIIERIFEPYFTTKFKSDGTGIGLYMSKMIIDSMHGSLTVENIDNGACFTISIPRRNNHA